MYEEIALVVGEDMATDQFAKYFDDMDGNQTLLILVLPFEEVLKGKLIASSIEVPSQARSNKRGVVTKMRVSTNYWHHLENQ